MNKSSTQMQREKKKRILVKNSRRMQKRAVRLMHMQQKTSNPGLQYCRRRVGRGAQPPSSFFYTHKQPQLQHLKLHVFYLSITDGRMDGQSHLQSRVRDKKTKQNKTTETKQNE